MKYETVDFKHMSLGRLNEDQYRGQNEELISRTIKANEALHGGAIKEWQRIVQEIADIHGTDSPIYRTARRLQVPAPPPLQKQWLKILKQAAQWKADQEYRVKLRARSKAHYARQKAAVNELLSMGYELGRDFGTNRAITFLKRKKAEIENMEADDHGTP